MKQNYNVTGKNRKQMVAITETVLENLRKLIASKATLIQKALKADRMAVETTED